MVTLGRVWVSIQTVSSSQLVKPAGRNPGGMHTMDLVPRGGDGEVARACGVVGAEKHVIVPFSSEMTVPSTEAPC